MGMLSPADVAELPGLSRSAIYRAIEDGDLVASKLRGRIRIDRAEVDAWKERSRVRPHPVSAAYEPPLRSRVAVGVDSVRGQLQALKEERVA